MKLLLDSHTWLWLAIGIELDSSAVQLCLQAAAEERLFLSPFSIWELASKAEAGRLEMTGSVRSWISEAIAFTGVRQAAFTFDVAVDMPQLPKSFHKDPADRALASTCRVHRLTLLTRDRTLLRLASENIFRALPI